MTSLFFVRHAQPEAGWPDDRTRPLTPLGLADSLPYIIRLDFEGEHLQRSTDLLKLDRGY